MARHTEIRRRGFDGVGFVLTNGDPFFAVDLDHVVDLETGKFEPWALDVVRKLNTYTEFSPSGTGLRAIGRGKLPPGTRKRGPAEMYDTERYVTVTGHVLPGFPTEIRDCSTVLADVHRDLFPTVESANGKAQRVPDSHLNLSDAEVVNRATSAANGKKFNLLWRGDVSGYPSHSEADAAFMGILDFWTTDPDQKARLLRMSGLYCEKHDRADYIERTIDATTGDGPHYGDGMHRTTGSFGRASEPSEHSVSPASPDWPEPGELPADATGAPTMPPELVPAPFRPWLTETADLLSVPLEFLAVPAFVSLGSVVGRALALAPNEKSDWIVPLNTYGTVVAPPGWLKSPSLAEALRPINRLAALAREVFAARREDLEAEAERIEIEISVEKTSMKKATERGEQASLTQLTNLKRRLRDLQSAERRYLTHDATVEKLGELLQQNPRGMLIVRDELAGWLMMLEREGRQGEREFFLEAWSGTGRYDFDRIGRGSVPVESLTLSIIGGIQPGKLNRWMEGAISGDDEADGLVQRFGLIAYPDALGEYRKPTRWPDSAARSRAFDIFHALDTMDIEALNPERDERGIPWVRFDADAQRAWDDWYAGNQHRIRSAEMAETPAFASFVAKQGKNAAALALLVALTDAAAGGFPPCNGRFTVGADAVFHAAALVEFFEAHAAKLYAPELNPGASPARALANHILKGKVTDGASVRDITRHHWGSLATVQAVDLAVGVLSAIGWLRIEEVSTGGRPSEVIRLNPRLEVRQ